MRVSVLGLRACLAGAALSCLLALVGVSFAGATTYCVEPATGCAGGTLPTLTLALTAAFDNPGADDVHLGPVSYSADGPWAYEDLTGTNPVTIWGDESYNTHLRAATGPTLTLRNGNLHRVDVTPADGATGLYLRSGAVSDAWFFLGTGARGVDAADATIERVMFPFDTGGDVSILAGDDTAISDIVSRTPRGVAAAGFDVAIRRATIMASGPGAYGISNGMHLTIFDSLIGFGGDTSAVGIDSYCTTDFAGSVVNAANLTIIGPGFGKAIRTAGDLTCSPTVSVSSSLVTGVGTVVSCLGNETSYPTIAYSDVDLASAGAVDGLCQPGVDAGHNFWADPKLNTDVPYKPVPRFDSPLVDAGDPADPGSDQPTDRLGVPRAVNGRRDIGAFEYGRRPPELSIESSAASALPGQSLTFTAETSDRDPGDAVTVGWAFDDGSTATGPVVEHVFSGEGPHTATATATDSAGVSTTKSLSLTVARPAALPGPPGGPALPGPPDPARRDPPPPPPPPLAASDLLGLPSAKRCLARRELRIRVRRRAGTRVVSAVITVNGKRRRPLTRQSGLRDPLVVRALPAGRSTITITLTTSGGRSLEIKRTYRRCKAKRRVSSRRAHRRTSRVGNQRSQSGQ